MAVVKIRSSECLNDSKIHFMPCTIKGDGPANVSKYFEPNIIKNSDEFLQTSFRGYPLLGREIDLPKNYRGYVLHETCTKINEETDRTVYVKDEFSKITYWNYDQIPSVKDGICNALNWITLAKAIHEPTESQEDK